jgi:CRP/FNR family transcriptional regulator, nitrogen oxide reductase regulator
LEALALLNQKKTLVPGFPLFSDVSPNDCASIISAGREKHYRRKQTIFSEGDPVRQVVFLLSGFVKIIQVGSNGDEVILRVNGVGEMVCAFQLSVDCHHSSTAQAIQPSTAIVWDLATFERLLERFPAFRRNTIRALQERLQEMEQRFREVSTEKVGSRLSSELLRLSNRLGHTVDGGHLEISLSRSELAQLTGTTLFTVSRLLCRWQKLGIVSIGRKAVLIVDFAALTQLTLKRIIE